MKKILVGALGSLLLALPTLSSAIPMTWTYTGACDRGDCNGLSISGTIVGDPTMYGSDSELNEHLLYGEIDSYDFWIGSYNFSGGSLTAYGTYVLDTVGNIVGGSMKFGEVFALDFLEVGTARWSIKDCYLFGCKTPASGTGSYTTTTPVPEPGTLALFGLGVLATGFVARRRRVK